jgi:hypothetical protein
MKIRIPLVGLVKISFKSKKTLDLEHVMESFGKDSSVKFPSKPSVGTFGFTGTTGTTGTTGITAPLGMSGTISGIGCTGVPVFNSYNPLGIALNSGLSNSLIQIQAKQQDGIASLLAQQLSLDGKI